MPNGMNPQSAAILMPSTYPFPQYVMNGSQQGVMQWPMQTQQALPAFITQPMGVVGAPSVVDNDEAQGNVKQVETKDDGGGSGGEENGSEVNGECNNKSLLSNTGQAREGKDVDEQKKDEKLEGKITESEAKSTTENTKTKDNSLSSEDKEGAVDGDTEAVDKTQTLDV